MPKLAEHIHIDEIAGKILIDGEEFPYFINESGPEVEQILEDGFSSVTIPVLVNKVTFTQANPGTNHKQSDD